jgi:hypothetical protein
MLKTDKLIVNSSFLFNSDILLNNIISQDYNIKFAGRPSSSVGKSIFLSAQDAQSGGTNLSGGNLTIAGGISTGTGSSSIFFKTAKAGSSGTTDNTPSTKLTITGTGVFPIFMSATVNPTTADIPSGTSSVYKNTTTGDLQVWVNDGGTIKTLTPPTSNSSSDFWLSAKITYGAAGDGVADDAPELTNAFSASNTIVYLPSGAYKVNSTVALSGASNVKIIGSKNTKITSTVKTLLSMTNCNNIEIENIVFESTASDTTGGSDTTNGLIKINGGNGCYIHGNTFNATNALTDGIKITVDDTHVVSNLYIEKNYFNGIGQRGIEITSSTFVNQNLKDIYIGTNLFNNTGTKNSSNGQAIVIKTYAARVKIASSNITDANGIGIECDGIDTLSLINNDMYAVTRAYKPYKISNATTAKTTTNFILNGSNIKVKGVEDSTIQLENISNFNISGNEFNAGTVKLKANDGNFTGNTVYSNDNRVVWVEANSDKLFIANNLFNNVGAPTPLEPYFTEGSGVTNIMAANNRWFSATGNGGYVISSGGTNNTFINVWGA